jgi:hypothetical protein
MSAGGRGRSVGGAPINDATTPLMAQVRELIAELDLARDQKSCVYKEQILQIGVRSARGRE